MRWQQSVSEKIISNFDGIISIFYDEEDRLKGYIESSDRSGNKRIFPVMTISIGVAHNRFIPVFSFGRDN